MEIEVRPATAADEAWLFALHEDAHRELVETAYGPWEQEQQLEFFRLLVDDHAVSVMEQDGARVGAVYLGSRQGDVWLELIEVRPERQSQGIGAAGLEWVVSEATAQDRGTLLQVHRLNIRARRLYERAGFVPVGDTDTHHLLRHP
jgi:GNAT superfamily N-acetyltransferase